MLERRLVYFPERDGVGATPGEDVWLTTADGVKIHGWHLRRGDGGPEILHLHGNAGNLESRRQLLDGLHSVGANVLAIDYRGYGRSEGVPTEAGLNADARAAYEWLAERVSPQRIVVHGESLGAGPACELASAVQCGGLIVQSAFTSVPDLAPRLVAPLVRLVLRARFDNLSKVKQISCRKLFIHSRADEMISFAMAERLFAAAADPKEHAWFDAVGHNEMAAAAAALLCFFDRAMRRQRIKERKERWR